MRRSVVSVGVSALRFRSHHSALPWPTDLGKMPASGVYLDVGYSTSVVARTAIAGIRDR